MSEMKKVTKIRVWEVSRRTSLHVNEAAFVSGRSGIDFHEEAQERAAMGLSKAFGFPL
jgi:hypothetical protein